MPSGLGSVLFDEVEMGDLLRSVAIVTEAGIHVDLLALENYMKAAIARAASMLGYATHLTVGAPLAAVQLQTATTYDLGVSNPVSAAERISRQQDFRAWCVGNALVEIDQSFHGLVVASIETMIDLRAWATGQQIADHKPRLANTSAVFKEFYERAGAEALALEFANRVLDSLVNARNALVHDRGIVTTARLRGEHAMSLTWPGRDLFITRKNGLRRPIPPQAGYRVQRRDVGCQIDSEDVVRVRKVGLGDRISLEPFELAEIIFFYQDAAIGVVGSLSAMVQEMQKPNPVE